MSCNAWTSWLAKTKDQAELRYNTWKSRDPFSDIPPALLNSADIAKYVAATSVLFPFDIRHLKSAAYEMRLSPEIWWWDREGTLHKKFEPGETHCIKRNSIMFFTTEESFYLPYYLAARFNLIIKHVHQGMLLGTGPLVNPEYCGKLMIPLHNLTNNDYSLHIGEPIISVELTKISPNKIWIKDSIPDLYINGDMQYVKNPSEFKTGADFSKYLNRAREDGRLPGILSSISELEMRTKDMEIKEKDFEKNINEQITLHKKVAFWSAISLLAAILLGLIALFVDLRQFTHDTAFEIRSKNEHLLQQSNEQSKEIEELKSRLETLSSEQLQRTQPNDRLGTEGTSDGIYTDMRNNRGR